MLIPSQCLIAGDKVNFDHMAEMYVSSFSTIKLQISPLKLLRLLWGDTWKLCTYLIYP